MSSSTLDALKAFYAERDAHSEKFAKLQVEAEERLVAGGVGDSANQGPLSMDLFTEDWNESQFWVCLADLVILGEVGGRLTG